MLGQLTTIFFIYYKKCHKTGMQYVWKHIYSVKRVLTNVELPMEILFSVVDNKKFIWQFYWEKRCF